jgi:hypothetical protein
MTALDDLNTYRKFAQAHVDGLKNLIDDFKALYDSMPAPRSRHAADKPAAPAPTTRQSTLALVSPTTASGAARNRAPPRPPNQRTGPSRSPVRGR